VESLSDSSIWQQASGTLAFLSLISSVVQQAIGAAEVRVVLKTTESIPVTAAAMHSSSLQEDRTWSWLQEHPEVEYRLLQGEPVRMSSGMLFPMIGSSGLEGLLDIRFHDECDDVPDALYARLHDWCRASGSVLTTLRRHQAEKDGFAAGIHALVTPLAAIRGFTRMLLENRDGRATAEQQEFLSTILANVERMVDTIGGLRATAEA
jgi:hypothetical protein